jgi:hypothetical protein
MKFLEKKDFFKKTNFKNKRSISNLILTVLFVWSTVTHSQTKSLFKIKLAERPTGVIFPTIFYNNPVKGWLPFHKGLCEEMTTEEKRELTDYVNGLKPTETIVDACEYAECVFHPAVYVSPIDFKIMRYAGVVIEKNMDILNYKLGKFLESRWSCEVGGNPDLEYRSIPTLKNIDYDINASQSTCQNLTPDDFRIIREDRKIFKELFGDGKEKKTTAFKLFFDVLLNPAFALDVPDLFGERGANDLSAISNEMHEDFSKNSLKEKDNVLKTMKENQKRNEARIVKHVSYCNDLTKDFIKDAMISYRNGDNVRALTNIGLAEQNLAIAFETASVIEDKMLKNRTISSLHEKKAKITEIKNAIQRKDKVSQDLYKEETENEKAERSIRMNLHEISRKEEDPDFKVTKVSVDWDGSVKEEKWKIPTHDNATNYDIIPDELKKELVAADLQQELEARGLNGISQEIKDTLISKISSLKNIDFDQLLGKKVKGGLEKIKLLKDKLANREKLGITLPPKIQQKYENNISKIKEGLALTSSKIQNAGHAINNQTHKWKNRWSNNKGKLGQKNSNSFNNSKGKESNNTFDDNKGSYNYNYNNFGGNNKGGNGYNHSGSDVESSRNYSGGNYGGKSSNSSFSNNSKMKSKSNYSTNNSGKKTNSTNSNGNTESRPRKRYPGSSRATKSKSSYSANNGGRRVSSGNLGNQLASITSSNSLERDLTSVRSKSKSYVLEIGKNEADKEIVKKALENILDKIDNNYSKIKNKKLWSGKNDIVTKKVNDMECFDKKYFTMKVGADNWHSIRQLLAAVRKMKPNDKFCIYDDKSNRMLEMELTGTNIIVGYKPNLNSSANIKAEELNKELKEGLVYFAFHNLYLFELFQRKGVNNLIQKLKEIKREDLLNKQE